MGFPSPAIDYVERRLNPNDMFTTAGRRILGISDDFAVIETEMKLAPGEILLILCDGQIQFARLQGKSLIMSDGEAIEGETMEKIEVRSSAFISSVHGEDDCPGM